MLLYVKRHQYYSIAVNCILSTKKTIAYAVLTHLRSKEKSRLLKRPLRHQFHYKVLPPEQEIKCHHCFSKFYCPTNIRPSWKLYGIFQSWAQCGLFSWLNHFVKGIHFIKGPQINDPSQDFFFCQGWMSTCHVSIYWSDHKINNLKVNAGTWTYSNCAIVKKNKLYFVCSKRYQKVRKPHANLKRKKPPV